MATRKAAAKESGAQEGRTGVLKVIRLSEAWPWLLLMSVGLICILAEVLVFVHDGVGKYLYISACAWAIALGFIGFVGYVTGKVKTTEEERDSKPAVSEELHAEIEAGRSDYPEAGPESPPTHPRG